MDESLSKYDLTESTVNLNLDSNSDQSDNFEDILDPVDSMHFQGKVDEAGDRAPENLEGAEEDVEDFDNNLPETVTLLRHPTTNAKVYLVGTAHFSKQSQEEVIRVIRVVKPHTIMLELCESRTSLLTFSEEVMLEASKQLNYRNVMNLIKRHGVYCGLTYVLILNLNKHITKEIGMPPGGEFRVAYEEARKIQNCAVILGDRPIKITLLRALSKLSWFQTFKLAFKLLFSKETINKEDVENCKRRDMLEQLLAEMAEEYPALGQVFVDERDIFLTHSLQQAASKNHLYRQTFEYEPQYPLRVVGVVGIGHVIGMTKLWPHSQAQSIREVVVIPPPSTTSKILKLTIKLSFYTLAGYLVFKYVPVPKTVRRTFQAGLQNVIDGSYSSLDYVLTNVKNHKFFFNP